MPADELGEGDPQFLPLRRIMAAADVEQHAEPALVEAVHLGGQQVEGQVLHRLIGQILNRVGRHALAAAAGLQPRQGLALDGQTAGPDGLQAAARDADAGFGCVGVRQTARDDGVEADLVAEPGLGDDLAELDVFQHEDTRDRLAAVQRDGEGLDPDHAAGEGQGAAVDSHRRLVEAEREFDVGQGRDGLQPVDVQPLTRRGLQRSQTGEVDRAAQTLHRTRRAVEVEARNGEPAGAGSIGVRTPVDTALESDGAGGRGADEVASQGAQVVGLEPAFREGDRGRLDGQSADPCAAVVRQGQAAQHDIAARQVEGARPLLVGQPGRAPGDHGVEPGRGRGVDHRGPLDAGFQPQTARPPGGRETAARIGEAKGEERGGRGEITQGAVRAPCPVADVDHRPGDRADLTGDVGHIVLIHIEPLNGHRGAAVGDIGQPASGGGQATAGPHCDAAGEIEVQCGATVETGGEAIGRQAPLGNVEGRFRQAAAARGREGERAAAGWTGAAGKDRAGRRADRQHTAIGGASCDCLRQPHLGARAAGDQGETGGVEREGGQGALHLRQLRCVVPRRRAEQGPAGAARAKGARGGQAEAGVGDQVDAGRAAGLAQCQIAGPDAIGRQRDGAGGLNGPPAPADGDAA